MRADVWMRLRDGSVFRMGSLLVIVDKKNQNRGILPDGRLIVKGDDERWYYEPS